MHIVFLSPPFYSHFQPMLTLASAYQAVGVRVTFACTPAFKEQVIAAGYEYRLLEINRNANTGIAQNTDQQAEEAQRLAAFFDATKLGPIETLALQARHRKADMLANSEELLDAIRNLFNQLLPDMFVVDQLSYGVTLALYGLHLPFVTFCPGHPTYIPRDQQRFGVPYAWPQGFRPSDADMQELTALVDEVDAQFTRIFNKTLKNIDSISPPVQSAFRLASEQAILFNYPDFGYLHKEADGPKKIFMGACFQPQSFSAEWKSRLADARGRDKILISLGTFLSARNDVLERLIVSLQTAYPEMVLFVAAGASLEKLAHLSSERVILSEFLPQIALLPEMDLVIHHAGNNSFTETLYYGKPAILLPFSSDQFAIAHDAEQHHLGVVLDPNRFTDQELLEAVDRARQDDILDSVSTWQQHIHSHGAAFAVKELIGEFQDGG